MALIDYNPANALASSSGSVDNYVANQKPDKLVSIDNQIASLFEVTSEIEVGLSSLGERLIGTPILESAPLEKRNGNSNVMDELAVLSQRLLLCSSFLQELYTQVSSTLEQLHLNVPR